MLLSHNRILFFPEETLFSPVFSLKQRVFFIRTALLRLSEKSTDQFTCISDNRKADMKVRFL